MTTDEPRTDRLLDAELVGLPSSRPTALPAAPMTGLLQHGPAAAVSHPVRDPEHRVGWLHPQTP
ncbi:hypothetical protein [Streptomyces rishiriensis]|uniref:hypothetical protein n=1 Tax=Streptomyces rishiriensis TaxID=68264 RepID=UPI0027D84B5E|nr:hypothetical protein [Streptomyces rishiriensis]